MNYKAFLSKDFLETTKDVSSVSDNWSNIGLEQIKEDLYYFILKSNKEDFARIYVNVPKEKIESLPKYPTLDEGIDTEFGGEDYIVLGIC